MNVIVLPPAKVEAREAKEYYNQQRDGLGEEFLDALDEAVKRITLFPHAWSRLSKNVRRCRTKRFPYGVVYAVRGTNIIVEAVMHLKRKPGYWRDRLQGLPPDV